MANETQLRSIIDEMIRRKTLNVPDTQTRKDFELSKNTTNLGNVSGQSNIPVAPTATAKQGVDTTQLDNGDPVRKFNLALMDMLKKAQGGETKLSQEKAQLEREAYQSGREVFTGAEANMTPEAKMAALNRNVDMYNPSIQAATTKIKQLGDIADLFQKTYGQDWNNLIPATKEDAETFRAALRSGATLPTDILTKYGKFLTTDDWAKWAEANKKGETQPSSYKEWELAGGLAGTGKTYAQFIAPKATSSGGGSTKLTTEQIKEAERADVAGELIKLSGSDGYVSPENYLMWKKRWVQEGNIASDFDKYFRDFRNPKQRQWEEESQSFNENPYNIE
jgi:hypothetical protein